MSLAVRYRSGALLTYSLLAYAPWEGYNLSITGTEGRIESTVAHRSYINAAGDVGIEGTNAFERIRVFPMWKKPYDVEVPSAEGGHGGGDPILLESLFGNPPPDPLQRAASHVDGAYSILVGIAANRSIRTGMPVRVDDLVTF